MTGPHDPRALIRAGTRRGFSLIETMMGVTLLTLLLTSVARLDYEVMQQTTVVARATYGNASLLQQMNRFLVLPYDSLPAHAGCVTVAAPPVPNTSCATVTTVTAGVRQVTIVLQLTGTTTPPDTVILQRGSATGGNPFNSP